MLKSVNTKIIGEVGKSASFLLNQLYLWSTSKNTTTVFRTNEKLVEDLDGVISIRTLSRAKKILIEKGYVTTSFDKGRFRATHYTLTQKALELFASDKQDSLSLKNKKTPSITKKDDVLVGNVKHDVANTDSAQICNDNSAVEAKDEQSTILTTNAPKQHENRSESTHDVWLSKDAYKKKMQDQRKQGEFNKEMIVSKNMKESFNEGFSGNVRATKGVPAHLLTDPRLARMLKNKSSVGVLVSYNTYNTKERIKEKV